MKISWMMGFLMMTNVYSTEIFRLAASFHPDLDAEYPDLTPQQRIDKARETYIADLDQHRACTLKVELSDFLSKNKDDKALEKQWTELGAWYWGVKDTRGYLENILRSVEKIGLDC